MSLLDNANLECIPEASAGAAISELPAEPADVAGTKIDAAADTLTSGIPVADALTLPLSLTGERMTQANPRGKTPTREQLTKSLSATFGSSHAVSALTGRKTSISRRRRSSRLSRAVNSLHVGMNRVTLSNEAPNGVPFATGQALEYLAQHRVHRTIAGMVKVLCDKLPSRDMEVRICLLEWLLSRIPYAELKTQGIEIELKHVMEPEPKGNRHGRRKEDLLRNLEQKFLEETEIHRTQIDVCMTDAEVGSFRRMFHHFDTEGIGGLDTEALHKVMTSCEYNPSTREFDTNFAELAREVNIDVTPENGEAPLSEQDSTVTALTMAPFLRFMHIINPARQISRAAALGFDNVTCARYKKMFMEVDQMNTGLLDKMGVLNAIRILEFSSSAKAIFRAFNELDTDKDGCIDFLEFLQLSLQLSPDEEQKAVERCEISSDEYAQFKFTFAKFDKVGDAVLKREQIWGVLADLEVTCLSGHFDTAMYKVDKHRAGVLDFVDMLRFVTTIRLIQGREEFMNEQAKWSKTVGGWVPEKVLSVRDIFDFQHAFNKLDSDRSGFLEKHEVMALTKSMKLEFNREDNVSRMHLLLDSVKENDVSTNEPYSIDFDEFVLYLRKIISVVEMEQRVSDVETGLSLGFSEEEIFEFREVASMFGQERGHGLNRDELHQLLETVGHTNLSPEIVDDMFNDFDTDGSDCLEFGEFLHVMKALSHRYEEPPKD